MIFTCPLISFLAQFKNEFLDLKLGNDLLNVKQTNPENTKMLLGFHNPDNHLGIIHNYLH